jgi:predicted Zn-dependent protease
MAELDWPDNHRLEAAVGWLALGNATEARAELVSMSTDSRQMPEVLDFEWELLAKEKSWEEAATIADSRVQLTPGEPTAWIQRSYALHEAHHTQEAWDKLLPAASLFPEVGTVSYNLACYACQLGQMDTARRWLRKAFVSSRSAQEKAERIKHAWQDDDLKPLWDELREGRLG